MKDVSAIDGKRNAANSWVPSQGNLDPRPLTHRRAASTTTRPAEWTAGDDQILAWPRQLTKTSQPVHVRPDKIHQIKYTAQPNVTFDAMESSVIKPDHSEPDHTTSTSRSFLSKTFSLQDRRSKSDDANLAKKKSLRATLLPSSLIRSPSLKREDSIPRIDSAPIIICPLCNLSLSGLSTEDASLHVNSCLDQSFSQTVQEEHTVFELPGSDLTFTAAELPAPVSPQRLMHSNECTRGPKIPVTDPDTLSNLHRAYSKRDLSMDKFEAGISLQPSSTVYNRSTLQVSQRQILLLGDPQCGKTWLSRAWCGGTFIEAHSRCVFFTKVLNGMEFILHDRTALEFIRDNMRRAYPGNLPVVLLCFDISSVESFENIERRWNHEADLYPENVPKILVGCKKDLKAETARSVWTRDAYKMTAKINAKAYFETSAVTKEGLEALFSHVAQMPAR
jgi:small GTP-binding protein